MSTHLRSNFLRDLKRLKCQIKYIFLVQSKSSLLGIQFSFELIHKLVVVLLGFQFFYYDLWSEETISVIVFKVNPKAINAGWKQLEGADGWA